MARHKGLCTHEDDRAIIGVSSGVTSVSNCAGRRGSGGKRTYGSVDMKQDGWGREARVVRGGQDAGGHFYLEEDKDL